jgi:hypothetical protein
MSQTTLRSVLRLRLSCATLTGLSEFALEAADLLVHRQADLMATGSQPGNQLHYLSLGSPPAKRRDADEHPHSGAEPCISMPLYPRLTSTSQSPASAHQASTARRV